jgi:hypothetical protein
MKTEKIFLTAVLLMALMLPTTSFSQTLIPYDDFSGASIDKTKWRQGEFVREIKDGKLLFKQASPNPIVVTTTFPYVTLTSLDFTNANSVHSMQADVSITSSFMSGDGNTAARLEGQFFNDGTPGSGNTGDIYAELALLWTNSGVKGFWWLGRYAGEGWSSVIRLGGGEFLPDLSVGTTYTLYLGYDVSTNQLTFRITGIGEKIFGPADGLPSRVSDPKGPNKSLETWVQIRNNVSSGYISATFDNVHKNGAVYDDFSASVIDSSKWATYEFVREISGGQLLSKTKSDSASVYSIFNSLEVVNPSLIREIQAKVTPVTYENSQGADAVARIAGYFYNDGTSAGTRIGQVGGQVRIGGTGPTPVASWFVWKETDETGNAPVELASGTFTTPVVLGNTYTLFLGWDGSRFMFKIDDEVANYSPVTSINPSKFDFKAIGTRILNPAGKEANIEALFDDVMVNGFIDVPIGDWAYRHIMEIYNAGITGGCSTNPPRFCPDEPITRGQMAVFVETSLGHPANVCDGRFADVPTNHPFCGFIERMADDGITSGCGGGNFCPDDPVTRGQMAVFIEAALGHASTSCTGQFADVPTDHVFCRFIEHLAADGITSGCGGGNFCPDNPVTRAQMAVFLVAAPEPLSP